MMRIFSMNSLRHSGFGHRIGAPALNRSRGSSRSRHSVSNCLPHLVQRNSFISIGSTPFCKDALATYRRGMSQGGWEVVTARADSVPRPTSESNGRLTPCAASELRQTILVVKKFTKALMAGAVGHWALLLPNWQPHIS